ncbi:MAG: LytR/AlgR family response regulator transcription factor [Campylobacterota bacterium]
MKILLVDDEKLALSRLERMTSELKYDYTALQDSSQALEEIKQQPYDIAVLDINMPGIDGIELAKQMQYHRPSMFIVFQTAYDQHALKAYELGAVGYLLKPFQKEDLERNIKRASNYAKSKPRKFMTKNGNEYYLVDESDIFYVEADLTEVIIRSSHGFSYYNKKISQMQNLLSDQFFKIHRSCIINMDKIEKMRTMEQSKIEFSFRGIQDSVESSKDGAKRFREYMESI